MSKASMYFNLENMDDKQDMVQIKRELDTLSGVMSVSVSADHKRVAVDFDTTGTNREKIRRKIIDLGFAVSDEHFENHVM